MTSSRQNSYEDLEMCLKVCTWNILADCCCDDSDQGFPFTTESARDPYERARKQLLVIAKENADLIGLQEVDKPERFLQFLSVIGYDVTYFKRDGSPLGTLVAIKKSLQMIMWEKAELPENRFLLGVSFSLRGMPFTFYTTHLKAKREGELARIEQSKSIAVYCENAVCNYIVAGDFNDLPGSTCVSIMKKAGFVNVSDAGVLYYERPYTTYKTRRSPDGKPDTQKKIEDYIFFKGPNVTPVYCGESKYLASLRRYRNFKITPPGLPNDKWPSDHLCLRAIFHADDEAVAAKRRNKLEEERKMCDEGPPFLVKIDEDDNDSVVPGATVFPSSQLPNLIAYNLK